jgi:hypothetical protein
MTVHDKSFLLNISAFAHVMVFAAFATAAEPMPMVAEGDGQITQPVIAFADPSKPDSSRIFYGQRTTTAKIVLTASNGFFDNGVIAQGSSPVEDAADKNFIVPDFATIDQWSKIGTTLRWHLWIEKTGTLCLNSHFTVNAADAGSKLTFQINNQEQILTTRSETNPARPQGSAMAFTIKQIGWQTLTVRLDSLGGKQVGSFHRLELFGDAATDSRLLRARWRPAACHARFSSSTLPNPKLWVMTTRIAESAKVPSYSPVTTPFGYFGTSFTAQGTSSPTANFSLWSFSTGKPKPQEQWSHMLAAGSMEAEFGSFGHEGSGVKLRGGWQPFGNDTREVTLALRAELSGPWIQWFGYYLDPLTKRFRLYAAGAEWNAKKKIPSLNPGAFVEQPGPPQRERSGDLIRDIQRRGWMLDEKHQWHLIDTMTTSKGLAAKHWNHTPDGWFSMGMGGMVYHEATGDSITINPATTSKPEWLENEQALKDLYKLPAIIGTRKFTDIGSTSAKIVIPLSNLDLAKSETATITAFYGNDDCLTLDRELGYREVKTKHWTQSSKPVAAQEGDNVIELLNLSPSTKTFVRILMTSPRGRIWSFETDQFETKQQ